MVYRQSKNLKGERKMDLYRTDPEFAERFQHFAFGEVINEENQQLEPSARYMAVLATLIGCGGVEVYKEILSQALENGITPTVAKEIVYQATDYLGYGRMLPFLNATNEILTENGIELPLDGQATTTLDNRLEKGIEAQAEIFGEHMKEAWKAGHINRWLAANCFGDYYTRKGLTLSERELITFCFLMAQGGCGRSSSLIPKEIRIWEMTRIFLSVLFRNACPISVIPVV